MKNFNLNLLQIFVAVYEERRISRAAARLGVTPSAISHSLARLRDAVGDPLFAREPGGLQPTPRADELKPVIDAALGMVGEALAGGNFHPESSGRTFRIAAGAMMTETFAPLLIASAQNSAPNIQLHFWTSGPDLIDWLDEGIVDLAIGSFEDYPKRLVCEKLFEEQLIWVASDRHPHAHGLTEMADLVAMKRVGLSAGDGPVERSGVHRDKGLRRRARQSHPSSPEDTSGRVATEPQAVVYDNRSVLAIVEQTDMVALVPSILTARLLYRFAVQVLTQFEPRPTAAINMLWHQSRQHDGGHAWLRASIRKAVGTLSDGGADTLGRIPE